MARLGINLTRFQRNEKLVAIYTPRTAYKSILENDQQLLSDITLNFDRYTISTLKSEFQCKNWALNLSEFISTVTRSLHNWQVDLPNRTYRMVRCLTNLFEEIDINGNGMLQWQEFTNYIIEKATIIKNLRSKNEQIKTYTKTSFKCAVKLETPIPKVVYIPDLNKLALYQEGEHTIQFVDAETGQFGRPLAIMPKQLVVNMSTIKKQKDGKVEIKKKELIVPTGIRILDMLYIAEQKYKLLVTSTSDGYVRGWRNSTSGFILATQPDNQQEFVEHHFSQEVYCLAWDNVSEVLFCGQKEGSISIWNLKTDIQKSLTENSKSEQQTHTLMIMDMITVPKMHFMASGGMDGKVILWDTINHKLKWVYSEHTRGVLSLAYNQQLILLFSAGFDHKICIWNPYISTIIHRIQSHNSPILSLRTVESTYQLISLDSDGVVKVHDIRRFNFLSSFTVDNLDEGQKSTPLNFCVLNKPIKLCFVGKKVIMFEYDRNYNPLCADDLPAVTCQYHKYRVRFYTPIGNKIKIWSALTGELDHMFADVTDTQVTAFSLDHKQKCMLVGDLTGKITLFNANNGAKLQMLPGHSGEVTHILATLSGELNQFFTIGVDNAINIIKQTPEGYELVRTLNIRKDTTISCAIYCAQNKHIIVGTSMGLVGFYQSQTGKLIGNVNDPSLDPITSVSLMDVDAIVATSVTGMINVVSMPPRMSKYQKILSVAHLDPEKNQSLSSPSPSPILPGNTNNTNQLGIITSVYSNSLRRLFVVDDKSYLTCYNFQSLHSNILTASNFQLPKCKEVGARRNAHKLNKYSNFKLERMWTIKTHSEHIRSVQYIEQEQFLTTTAHDRKIRIWSAFTGQLIESLQQGNQKRQHKPMAYMKPHKRQIFLSNYSKNPTICINKQLKPDFNPFCINELTCVPQLSQKQGKEEWKLKVNFSNRYASQQKVFQDVFAQLQKSQVSVKETTNNSTKLKGLVSQYKESRVISPSQHQSFISFIQDVRSKQSHSLSKTVSNSILHCGILNTISKVRSKEQLKKQRQQHKQYIENLHRQEIQSKLCARTDVKIALSKEEAEAAVKLGKALMKLDKADRRPLQLINRIVVKDQKLPKIA